MEQDAHDLIQYLGVAGMGFVALALGIQRLIKEWRSNTAENHVISMMHTELDRLNTQHGKLSEEVGKLHDEIVKLNGEITTLTIENNKLRLEISVLTDKLQKQKDI